MHNLLRRYAAALLLLIVIVLPFTLFGQNLVIHYINVGWGGSVFVIGPNGTTILMEAGNPGKGTAKVVPYLQSIGYPASAGLDYTIAGHQHCDHIGGLPEVVSAGYDVRQKNYYNGSSYSTSCSTNWNTSAASTTAGGPTIMPVGTQIALGNGAKLTCIARNGSIIGGGTVSVSDENDRSIVCLIQYGGFNYLWGSDLGGGSIDQSCTGRSTSQADVETSVIQAIVPGGVSPMIPATGIDVLHCNHHGSESSTNKNWMNLTKPSVAIISTGAGQSSGFELPRINTVEHVLLAQATACITAPATLVLQTEEGNPAGTNTSYAGYCVGDMVITTSGSSTYTITANGSVTEGPDERTAAGLPKTINFKTSGLPIQLAAFTATAVWPNRVRLDWTTLSEVNNYGFEIQRLDESGFAPLPNSFVPGHGTTTEPHRYTFIDSSANLGQGEYRLQQVDLDGTVHYSDPVRVGVVASVGSDVPSRFELQQNYPNPFNPSTTIAFAMPEAGYVTLKIYDVLGREVASLLADYVSSGRHEVKWSAENIASGVYMYRITTPRVSEIKKMILSK